MHGFWCRQCHENPALIPEVADEWVDWVDESITGFRNVRFPATDDAAKAFKKRTPTNPYNARSVSALSKGSVRLGLEDDRQLPFVQVQTRASGASIDVD